jgi:Fe-S-cluster containining protein
MGRSEIIMKKNALEKKSLSQCNECDHLCCKYITEKIPVPRTIHDFDGLLWQLSHKNIKAFSDTTGWYLLVYNTCVHLKGNGECIIYENRPITCRKHSIEKCEYENPISKSSFQYFSSFQSLENYCKKKFKTWDNRF